MKSGGRRGTTFALANVVIEETDLWELGVQMLPPRREPIPFSRRVQPAYICLPSVKCEVRGVRGERWLRFALRPSHLSLQIGARGRTLTFISGVRSTALW